jgi:hypothetical protein
MAEHDTTANYGGAESPEPTGIGNRPATGARLVDHTTSLPTSFGGGQEATDFLGLSQDLVTPDAGATSSAVGAGAGLMPTTATSSTFSAEPEGGASWLLSERGESAPTEEMQGGDGSEEELEAVGAGEQPTSSGSKRILSVAVAVLLIGAAVTVAMRFSRKETPPAPQVAVNPNPSTKHAPAGDGSELASNPDHSNGGRQTILPDGTMVPVATTQPVVPTPTSEPVATTEPAPPEPAPPVASATSAAPARIGERRLSQWMARHGWSAPTEEGSGALFGAPTTPAGWPKAEAFAFASNARNGMPSADSVATADEPSTAVETVPLVLTEGGARDPKNPLTPFEPNGGATGPRKGPGELRFATQEDLASIWSAAAIPMDAIDGTERIVTPEVGMVRVVLTSGQIFDGRLYAVGQGQVWLETDFGRLALAGKRVRAIDAVVLEKQAKAVEALPRMRVRTPGGLFFGKVLARDDVHVTVLLDSGGRITLESNDVEPAPLGDTRVVGPVKP